MVLQIKDSGRCDKKNKVLSPPRVSGAPHQRAEKREGTKAGEAQEGAGVGDQGQKRKVWPAESRQDHTEASERSRAGSGATKAARP